MALILEKRQESLPREKSRGLDMIRARAPLRIGLAGGGTDVSPYPETFGGAVVSATVSRFAYASVQETRDGRIVLSSSDLGTTSEHNLDESVPVSDPMFLVKTCFNRLLSISGRKIDGGLTINTAVDAPPGSGLGSSSAMIVALVGALLEFFEVELSKNEIAKLAYSIERDDCKVPGGRQDQCSAVWGGINHFEFPTDDFVRVHPIKVSQSFSNEFEASTLLYFTGQSRDSAAIIQDQIENASSTDLHLLEPFHGIKEEASAARQALLKGSLSELAKIIDFGWRKKKATSSLVSNPEIENIISVAKDAGAMAAKVSGAGGGGFMFFVVPHEERHNLRTALRDFGGVSDTAHLIYSGLEVWRTP